MTHGWWWVGPVLLALSACASSQPVTGPAAGTSAAEETQDELALFGEEPSLERAVELVEAKRFDEALPHLEALEGSDEVLQDYYLYWLGVAEARLGDRGAFGRFTTLRTSYPQSIWAPAAALELGRLYRQAGNMQEAEAFLVVAAASPDRDVAAQAELERAQILIADGRDLEAAEVLQNLRREARGTSAVAPARALLRTLRAQNVALSLHGTQWLDEARLLLDERDWVGAEKALRAADPGGFDPDTQILLAEALKGQGNTSAAVSVLGLVVERHPDDPATARALYRMGQLLWNQDEDVAAEAAFRQFLKRYPDHSSTPDALYAIGRIQQAEGRDLAASETYERLARTYPSAKTAWEARWRIGWIEYSARLWAQAAGTFGALARASSDPAEVGSALYWQARALERTSRAGEAADLYRRVIAEAPVSYYAWRAEQRLGEERFDQAGQVRASPLPLPAAPPSISRFHLERYAALRQLGLVRFARDEVAALERESSDPAAREFVYYAYASTDDYPAARRVGRELDIPAGVRERVLYPLAFWPEVSQAAAGNQVDPLLVVSLIRQESLFDPQARSSADARGLMQLLPATARREAGFMGWKDDPTDRLYDPAVNVAIGVHHLRDLLDDYDGDPVKALAAYNGGTTAVDKWRRQYPELESDEFVESITYRETRDYVKRVLGNRRAYAILYAGG